jgi:ammonium transporter, Amt family
VPVWSLRVCIFCGGNIDLLLEQALANGAAIVWSFVVTFGIMVELKKTIGVRVSDEVEATGLDLALHSETANHSVGLR